MNDINEMPPVCAYCPYWEVCKPPYICPDIGDKEPKRTEKRTETHASDLIDRQLSYSCSHENDTISRRATIDALHEYFDGMLETDTWSPCDVYGLIEILPSAQPEIIRCKDCYHNHNCDIQYHAQAGDMFFCAGAERRTDE